MKTQSFFNFVICIIAGCTLTACNRGYLSVYTDYVTIESLASYYVNTPDPYLENPPFEQRLNIGWNIPSSVPLTSDTRINYTIRFRNRKEYTDQILLLKHQGRHVYHLSGDAYFENGGILTYKVQLMEGNFTLEEWKHQLWAELIIFKIPEE